MANHFSRSVDVAVSADEAWALVGDPAGVGSWFGAVAECRMEDDVRIATMRSGAVLREAGIASQPEQQRQRMGVQSVLGIIEQQIVHSRRKAVETVRIVLEKARYAAMGKIEPVRLE